eukprot:TRINITY_DN1372_c0_g1_i2.p1 TRINITY_DN1372_c0_g1~~TRINITY_DN1372_c0_g1_i2.p1  ORF type:complete len:712 (-),score=162.27 TRINITY_DN1372_c0_g1_i2:13-2148(-)
MKNSMASIEDKYQDLKRKNHQLKLRCEENEKIEDEEMLDEGEPNVYKAKYDQVLKKYLATKYQVENSNILARTYREELRKYRLIENDTELKIEHLLNTINELLEDSKLKRMLIDNKEEEIERLTKHIQDLQHGSLPHIDTQELISKNEELHAIIKKYEDLQKKSVENDTISKSLEKKEEEMKQAIERKNRHLEILNHNVMKITESKNRYKREYRSLKNDLKLLNDRENETKRDITLLWNLQSELKNKTKKLDFLTADAELAQKYQKLIEDNNSLRTETSLLKRGVSNSDTVSQLESENSKLLVVNEKIRSETEQLKKEKVNLHKRLTEQSFNYQETIRVLNLDKQKITSERDELERNLSKSKNKYKKLRKKSSNYVDSGNEPTLEIKKLNGTIAKMREEINQLTNNTKSREESMDYKEKYFDLNEKYAEKLMKYFDKVEKYKKKCKELKRLLNNYEELNNSYILDDETPSNKRKRTNSLDRTPKRRKLSSTDSVNEDINDESGNTINGTEKKKFKISFSSFNRKTEYDHTKRNIYKEYATQLGIEVSEGNPLGDSDITHIVVPPGSKITSKIILGVLCNKWIVTTDWIESCIARKRMVSETEFGYRSEDPVFKGKKFFFANNFKRKNANLLENCRNFIELSEGILETKLKNSDCVMVADAGGRNYAKYSGKEVYLWNDFLAQILSEVPQNIIASKHNTTTSVESVDIKYKK